MNINFHKSDSVRDLRRWVPSLTSLYSLTFLMMSNDDDERFRVVANFKISTRACVKLDWFQISAIWNCVDFNFAYTRTCKWEKISSRLNSESTTKANIWHLNLFDRKLSEKSIDNVWSSTWNKSIGSSSSSEDDNEIWAINTLQMKNKLIQCSRKSMYQQHTQQGTQQKCDRIEKYEGIKAMSMSCPRITRFYRSTN